MTNSTGRDLWQHAEKAFNSIHVRRLDKRSHSERLTSELGRWIRDFGANSLSSKGSNNRGSRIAHLYGLGGSGKTRLLNEVEQEANRSGYVTCRFSLSRESELNQKGIRWTKLIGNHLDPAQTKACLVANGSQEKDKNDLTLLLRLIRHFTPAAQSESSSKSPNIFGGLIFLATVAILLGLGEFSEFSSPVLTAAVAGAGILSLVYQIYEYLYSRLRDTAYKGKSTRRMFKRIGLDIGDLPTFSGEDMSQWPKESEKSFEKILIAATSLVLMRISSRNNAPVLVLIDVDYLPGNVEAIEQSISWFSDSLIAWADRWQDEAAARSWQPCEETKIKATGSALFKTNRKCTQVVEKATVACLVSHKLLSTFGDIAHKRINVRHFTPEEQARLYDQFLSATGNKANQIENRLRSIKNSSKRVSSPENKDESPPWPHNLAGGRNFATDYVLPRDIRLSTEAALTVQAEDDGSINQINLRNHFRSVWHSRAVDRLFPEECAFKNLVTNLARIPFFPAKLLDFLDRPAQFPDPRNNLTIGNNPWFELVETSQSIGPLFRVNKRLRNQLLAYRAHTLGPGLEGLSSYLIEHLESSTVASTEKRLVLLVMAVSLSGSLVQAERYKEARALLGRLKFSELKRLIGESGQQGSLLIGIAIHEELVEMRHRIARDIKNEWITVTEGENPWRGTDGDTKHPAAIVMDWCRRSISSADSSFYQYPSQFSIGQIAEQCARHSDHGDFWYGLEEMPEGPPWKTWPRYEIESPGDGRDLALELLQELESIPNKAIEGEKVLLKFRESMIARLSKVRADDPRIAVLIKKQRASILSLLSPGRIDVCLDRSFIARVIRTSDNSLYSAGPKLAKSLAEGVAGYFKRDPDAAVQHLARIAQKVGELLSTSELLQLADLLIERRIRNQTTLAWHYALFEVANALFFRVTIDGRQQAISTRREIIRLAALFNAQPPQNIVVSTESSPWERQIAWAIEHSDSIFKLCSPALEQTEVGGDDLARLAIAAEKLNRLEALAAFAQSRSLSTSFSVTEAQGPNLSHLLAVISCDFDCAISSGSSGTIDAPEYLLSFESPSTHVPHIQAAYAIELFLGRKLGGRSELKLNVTDAIILIKSMLEVGLRIGSHSLRRWVIYRMMHLALVAFRIARTDRIEQDDDLENPLRECIQIYAFMAVQRRKRFDGKSEDALSHKSISVPSVTSESAPHALIYVAAREISFQSNQISNGHLNIGSIVLVELSQLSTTDRPITSIVNENEQTVDTTLDFFSGSGKDEVTGFLPPRIAKTWLTIIGQPESENDNSGLLALRRLSQEQALFDSSRNERPRFCATVRHSASSGNRRVLQVSSRGAQFLSALADAVLPMGLIYRFSPEGKVSWGFSEAAPPDEVQVAHERAEHFDDFYMTGSNTVMVVPVPSQVKKTLIGGDGAVLQAFLDFAGIRRIALIDSPDLKSASHRSSATLRDSLDQQYVRSLLNNFFEDLRLCTLGNPTLFSSPQAGEDPRKERTFLALYRKFTGRSGVIVSTDIAATIQELKLPAEYWDRIPSDVTNVDAVGLSTSPT